MKHTNIYLNLGVIFTALFLNACATSGPSKEELALRQTAKITEVSVMSAETVETILPNFDTVLKNQLIEDYPTVANGTRPVKALVEVKYVSFSGDGQKRNLIQSLGSGIAGHLSAYGTVKYTFIDDGSVLGQREFSLSNNERGSLRVLARITAFQAQKTRAKKEEYLADILSKRITYFFRQ